MPVPKQLIDIGAISQLELTPCPIFNNLFMGGQDAHPTRNSLFVE
ncbi:hypothetical protein [Microcoleus vaginatus]